MQQKKKKCWGRGKGERGYDALDVIHLRGWKLISFYKPKKKVGEKRQTACILMPLPDIQREFTRRKKKMGLG